MLPKLHRLERKPAGRRRRRAEGSVAGREYAGKILRPHSTSACFDKPADHDSDLAPEKGAAPDVDVYGLKRVEPRAALLARAGLSVPAGLSVASPVGAPVCATPPRNRYRVHGTLLVRLRAVCGERREIVSANEHTGSVPHSLHVQRPVVSPAQTLQKGVANRPVEHGLAIGLGGRTVARVESIITLFQRQDGKVRGKVAVYLREQRLRVDGSREHETRHLALGVHTRVGAPCTIEPHRSAFGHTTAGRIRQGLLNDGEQGRLHGAAVTFLPAAKARAVVGDRQFEGTGVGGHEKRIAHSAEADAHETAVCSDA